MEFACALYVKLPNPEGFSFRVMPAVVSAANEDEAVGKVLRMFKKEYPETEGWQGHSCAVMEIKRGQDAKD